MSNLWSTGSWPDIIPWDYGYYAVSTGGHNDETLDDNIAPMTVSFSEDDADYNIYTHALGYSYSEDPNFMYCAESVGAGSYDGWLLPNCGLSGGASGGPWTQSIKADLGTGPIMSVNSYGPRRGRSYMGGPLLHGNDASCLFDTARTISEADLSHAGGNVGC